MFQRHRLGFTLLAIALFFAGCQLNPDKPEFPTQDTKAPEITFIRPNLVPASGYAANPYNNLDLLTVELMLTDNQELDRYQIDLFYRGDIYYLKTAIDSMLFTIVGTVSGNENHLTRDFTIEYDPLAGPYELKVTVWDSVGNKTEKSTFIKVQNNFDTQRPVVMISSPAANDTFSIGETIPITFNATDNSTLFDAVVRVRNTFNKEVISEGEYRFFPFTGPNGSHSFYIAPTTPGNYSVEVYVNDIYHNNTREIVPIYITTY